MQDYLRVIRQRWMVIVAMTFVGLALAAGFTFTQTPQYEARSQLFVSVKSGNTATDITQGNTFAEKRVTSYVNLATSPRVLQAVADQLGLQGGAKELAGKVVASTPAQTVLIDIKATDPSPTQAAKIADAAAQNLISAVGAVEDVSIVRLSIFENAVPASAPSSPRVPLNLAIGLALGLLVGIGLALLREKFDTRIKSQDDVEGLVTSGILGSFENDPSTTDHPLVTQGDQYSHRAESFRQLRTHLHFTNISGGAQSVVVSSSIPGEGKSTTAVNLAIMLAESGARVLLVDADLRRPKVADYLGLEGSVGLTGVLSHSVAFEDAVQAWGRGGILHVLTSGTPAPNPSELLGSPSMEKLIATFETQYEVVIIDAPPLLPVTDPAVLGSMASGVLLVVSVDGRTHKGELDRAVKDLEAVNARLLGLVVNRMDRVVSGHTYYDYRPEGVGTGRRGKRKS